MQSSDDGSAAFDLDNNKLFLTKIPFSDMGSLCNLSADDITGRILKALELMLHIIDQEHIALDMLDRITVASNRAITCLANTQESTDTWYGRWGSNYIYGTSNVLCCLACFLAYVCLVQDLVSSAILWLK